jgi:hypothetical protein
MRDASASSLGLFQQAVVPPRIGRASICGQIDGVACSVVLDRQTAVVSLLESLLFAIAVLHGPSRTVSGRSHVDLVAWGYQLTLSMADCTLL